MCVTEKATKKEIENLLKRKKWKLTNVKEPSPYLSDRVYAFAVFTQLHTP